MNEVETRAELIAPWLKSCDRSVMDGSIILDTIEVS
jgi:hypothetical protein